MSFNPSFGKESSTFFADEKPYEKYDYEKFEHFDQPFEYNKLEKEKKFEKPFESFEKPFEKSFEKSFDNSFEKPFDKSFEKFQKPLALDPEPLESLDIVGALSTLNLDAQLNELSEPTGSANSSAGSDSAPEDRKSAHHQILTPNPPAVGAFNTGTPFSTWGNSYVPFSAPPFTYPVPDPTFVNEMALQIAPFQLPDESSEEPLMRQFGDSLEFTYQGRPQRYQNERYHDERNYQNGPKFQHGQEKEKFPYDKNYRNFDYQNFDRNDRSFDRNDRSFDRNDRGFGEKDKHFDKSKTVWNQNQPYDRFSQYDRNYNYRRHNNSGVNVHRKSMNRRKGDDAAKYANAKLDDFKDEIHLLCKDQHGCRFLQRQLDLGKQAPNGLASTVVATMIFNKIYLRIVELMIDPFGNYLIQKLFENVSPDQRLVLVKNAAPDFVRIALDPHGTRALQKLVECISTREETQLVVASLAPHVVLLARDLNGNHVVQKCLQRLQPQDNQFVFDTAAAHCEEIATHRHGCCVLQRCLDHGSARQREQLSGKVAEIATTLSLDPFGNYVVQYVLTRGDERSVALILQHIQANVVSLSLHKFGSNVIEKSLRIARLTDAVIRELLKNTKHFAALLNDPFGNYVLQTSLDVASAGDLTRLAAALQPFLPNIKNTPHGRRILTKIQNL